MKKLLTLVVLHVFLSSSFYQLTLLGAYMLNQDFIAETFCINKDKPELSCKGKCHLKDMMAAIDTNQGDEQAVQLDYVLLPVYFENPGLQLPRAVILTARHFSQTNLLRPNYLFALFHPPESV